MSEGFFPRALLHSSGDHVAHLADLARAHGIGWLQEDGGAALRAALKKSGFNALVAVRVRGP